MQCDAIQHSTLHYSAVQCSAVQYKIMMRLKTVKIGVRAPLIELVQHTGTKTKLIGGEWEPVEWGRSVEMEQYSYIFGHYRCQI